MDGQISCHIYHENFSEYKYKGAVYGAGGLALGVLGA